MPHPLGTVAAVFIGPERRGAMQAAERVSALAGCGIEGDRFFRDIHAGAKESKSSQITLIEEEALEALEREYGVELLPSETRRNILTRGVPLNHLVGKRFRAGGAVLEGVLLCEPCEHLEGMTRPGVLKGLIHRGGLRARIVRSGEIMPGDPIALYG